jgi:hypothetical protein
MHFGTHYLNIENTTSRPCPKSFEHKTLKTMTASIHYVGSGRFARGTQDEEDLCEEHRRFAPQHNLEMWKTGKIHSQALAQETREPWEERGRRE